jgi:hypothetical protein
LYCILSHSIQVTSQPTFLTSILIFSHGMPIFFRVFNYNCCEHIVFPCMLQPHSLHPGLKMWVDVGRGHLPISPKPCF